MIRARVRRTRVWVGGSLLLLAACGGSEPSAVSLVPEHYRLERPLAAARDVIEVRAHAAAGEVVEVRGVAAEFVDGLAAFTLVDAALPDCRRDGMQSPCDTPWDYCCTDPQELAAASVTVELHEGDRVLRHDLRGFDGLDHLVPVDVRGRVERDEAGNVTVVADGLLVEHRAGVGR
jgi:hypothetical protein